MRALFIAAALMGLLGASVAPAAADPVDRATFTTEASSRMDAALATVKTFPAVRFSFVDIEPTQPDARFGARGIYNSNGSLKATVYSGRTVLLLRCVRVNRCYSRWAGGDRPKGMDKRWHLLQPGNGVTFKNDVTAIPALLAALPASGMTFDVAGPSLKATSTSGPRALQFTFTPTGYKAVSVSQLPAGVRTVTFSVEGVKRVTVTKPRSVGLPESKAARGSWHDVYAIPGM